MPYTFSAKLKCMLIRNRLAYYNILVQTECSQERDEHDELEPVS